MITRSHNGYPGKKFTVTYIIKNSQNRVNERLNTTNQSMD